MSAANARLVLSAEDRSRVDRVETLARSGDESVGPLLELLLDPSWAVRRAVVIALASLGEASIDRLEDILIHHRAHESRLSATVEALVATGGGVDARMMKLASGDHAPAVVCDAIQILGRRRVRAALPLLAALSRHADDNVAVASIEALGLIGGIETVDALIAAVEARSFFRTFSALQMLARTGDVRAVPPLAGLLDNPLYAQDAARALGRTGQGSAIAPLASLLNAPSAALVRAAAVALADLRGRYEVQFGDNAFIRRALRSAVAPAVAGHRIIEALPGAAPSELVPLARVLGWLGDDVAVARFVNITLDRPPMREEAAEALRCLGPAATGQLLRAIREGDSERRRELLPIVGHVSWSIDELLVCLDDADADVRVRASQALARLGNPAAVSALFRLIGDRDGRVSQAAAAAIQSLGSVETKALALEHARSGDARTRRAALRIISYFGYRDGLEILIEAMGDDDERVREAAIYGIPLVDHPLGTDALLQSVTHSSPRTRAAIMRALGQTSRTPVVVAALRTALSDDDAWVRYYACQALGRLAVGEACQEIVALMHDPAGQVRVAAVEALTRLDDEGATTALAEAARSDDVDMRRAAFLGLGMAQRPESVAILCEAAAAGDAATRLVALAALSEFDGPDVVRSLARAVSDPDEAVRTAALGYLSSWLTVPGDARVAAVLLALRTAEAEAATLYVGALTRMGLRSQAALESALLLDNVHARRAAASALAASGTPEAREVLVRAGSSDLDPDVRRICASAAKS